MAGRPPNRIINPPNRIRVEREARGMTLQQLAEALNLAAETVREYENGNSAVSIYRLEQIAKVFKLPPRALLKDFDARRDQEEEALLAVFRRLSPEDKDRALRMAMALLPDGRKARTGSE